MLSVRRQGQQFRQIGERLRGGRRHLRLLQPEVIDHQPRIGIARGQQTGLLQAPRAHEVHRQGVPRGSGQNPVEPWIGGIGRYAFPHHDPDADRAVGGRPVGDRIGHPGIGRIDRLDQPEPARMRRVNLEGVARIVAVHAERRDQQRTVHADGIHGSHHVVARDLRRPAENAGPGSARVVAFVGVHLGIYCQHGFPRARTLSSCIGYRYFAGRIIARHMCATGLLSKPRPCSGWRKLRPITSVNSSSSTFASGSNE